MRTIQRPGEYLDGFPHPDGSDLTKCRCPVCWHEFFLDTLSHLDILMRETFLVECPLCLQTRGYTYAYKGKEAEATAAAKRSKVRRKGIAADPPLFSGFDPGYDLRHKRTD